MTLPLSSWLDCAWRMNGDPRRETVAQAARILDAEVWNRHHIKLLFCDDADRFRDISTQEVERVSRLATPETVPEYPQLGTHADPTCRALSSETFYGLIGTRTDRPLPLLTMNSGALYDRHGHRTTLTGLFVSRRLWSDHPERDCAGLDVEFTTHQDTPWNDLPAVFLGTAWTHPERRGQGVMTTVSRLHRLVAWLRWPVPQFATVVPDSGAEKVFGGTDIGCVIEKRPYSTIESRVLFYPADAALTDAKTILAT